MLFNLRSQNRISALNDSESSDEEEKLPTHKATTKEAQVSTESKLSSLSQRRSFWAHNALANIDINNVYVYL